MKNLKLATKMLLLSVVLMASVVVVAFVAVGRLQVVNAQIALLVDSTSAKFTQAGSVRSNFLSAIRSQKNSVLALDDASSKQFAEASRAKMAASAATLVQLKALIDRSNIDEQTKVLNELESALEEFDKVNGSVLDLAVQNTNLKAKALIFGDLQRSIDTLSTWLLAWREVAHQPDLGTPSDAGTTAASLTAIANLDHALQQVPIITIRHIESSNEEELRDWERKLADLLSQLEQGLAGASLDVASQAEARTTVAEVKRIVDQITSLSRTDSNNRSAAMSLAEAKVASDEVEAEFDKLNELLTIEAQTGRKLSGDVYASAVWWIIGVTLAGIVLGALIAYIVTKSVVRPIAEVKQLAQNMAGGDLRRRLQLNQTDEVGELSLATNALADSLGRIVGEIQKVSEGLVGSAADLTGVSDQLLTHSETGSLRASSVASASEQLSSNISTMAAAAEEMSVNVASISSASEEMSVNVGSISSAAEQTSTNVGVVTTAVGEISASFADVLNDVREGSRIASDASSMADSATATIQTLSQSGNEISKVTEAIKMIALQTNLLALNATIEATSAGEAGKGFAVVAHEIKELANQSAKAAEDIARKIEGVQSDTRQAVNVIQNVSQIIKEINASSNRISQSVEKQTRAATMISQNVGEANAGVGEIARSIADVAKAAGDMSRSVAEAARGATSVARNVNEAAKAAGGISSDIHQVSGASRATNTSATRVHESAARLDTIGRELRKLVGRFKITTESNE